MHRECAFQIKENEQCVLVLHGASGPEIRGEQIVLERGLYVVGTPPLLAYIQDFKFYKKTKKQFLSSSKNRTRYEPYTLHC